MGKLLWIFNISIVLFTVSCTFSRTRGTDSLQVDLIYQFSDGRLDTVSAGLTEKGNIQTLVIPAENIPENVEFVEVHHPYATAKAGDEGFYVLCTGMYGTFKQREDGTYHNKQSVMPMFGVSTPHGAMTVILTGMRYEAHHLADLKDGIYRIFPRFMLEGDVPNEDIAVELHLLDKDATYADMAKVYRKYQLDREECTPLKERIKNNPELQYAANSMEVRVRMGWKPVPSPVGEQTAETEPPMKVAVTFDRVQQIVDEFKRQGVDKAEFCLVGWNIGGHDGRYPQIFPVDERLGGEVKLREAIKKAQHEGFQIVCHTNNTDAYSVSRIGDLWDEGYLLKRKDGSFAQYTTWGGGNMYETCPKCMYERFVKSDFEKIKDLGFRGIHYIDVFSTVNPRTCYSKEHPLTKEDFACWSKTIFKDAQQSFGGLGSEGGFDYCISNLDYSLYNSFHNPAGKLPVLIDRHVPSWNLVYHGIVLSNPYTATTNYTIKDPVTQLKLIEFGGRPMFYFYSKFRESGPNWMGDDDIRCANDEELIVSVQKIKEGYDEFESLKHLQLEFMEGHDQIAEKVFMTSFSDGTQIITNYDTAVFKYKGKIIEPLEYLILKP